MWPGWTCPGFKRIPRRTTRSSVAWNESAKPLRDLAPSHMPDQPWPEIRALGNRLRHEYDAIREDRLWDIVQIDLPPLRAACEETLLRLKEETI